MSQRLSNLSKSSIALLLIMILAAGLRLYGQDWDEGHYLHPDERFIATVSSDRVTLPADRIGDIFDPANSPINPRRDDANGNPQSFAYGTLPIYVQGTVSWAIDLVFDTSYGEYSDLYRVGRTLTAILDLLTLGFVYLIGRRLFSDVAGLIGAALYTLTVLPIQLSHFFTVDPWLTAFVTIALYLSIRYMDLPGFQRAALLGVAVGCAFATKASVPSLLAPLLLAFGVAFWRSEYRLRIVGHAATGAGVALAVFTLFEPYAIVRREPFIQDIRTQARIVRGIWDVPFTRQFVGLTPGVYELKNLFAYTVGPALLLAGLAAIAFVAFRFARSRDVALAIPLVWTVAYIPTLLITEARFLRYTLPLLPVIAVLAGGMLWTWMQRPGGLRAGQIATVVVLGVTAIWAFGFVSIYGSEHPRIAASNWIYDNVEAGSTLSAESWDDALPLRIEGKTQSYNIQSLDIYGDLPPEEKVDYLYTALEPVDYIVMSSDRLIYSVDNLPWRYAVQNEYYRRLLNGQLGFQLVYQAELRPELFGVRYDDSGADESFTVYDHPRVMIFERVEQLSREEFRDRLLWGINQPWEPQRYPAQEWLLLDQPVGEREAVSDIGWNSLAVDSAIFATILWLIALELFGLAVLPWSALIFRRTPDRGALATRLIGVLAVGWLVWIGASFGFWRSTALTVAICIVALAAASWGWFQWRDSAGRAPQLPTLRAYGLSAALMLAVFVPFLLTRAIYPDFWQTFLGGEKPFELAYLRAVAAAGEMPPYDPWYSDGAINYYYYGWHLVSTVGRLPGVGVTHAFQLAVPTFAALLAMQIALIAMMFSGIRRGLRSPGRIVVAPVVAIVALLFAGNLDAFRQVIDLRRQVPEFFDFWGSTRVIDFTINEFPYFSFIWADLHPHVMGMPVVALALALLVSAAEQVKRWPPERLSKVDGIVAPAVVGALALGSVFVINAWDLPLMIVVTVATLFYAGLLRSYRIAVVLAATGGVVVATGYAMFLPFHANFYSVVEGVARADAGSALGQFLTMWGIFFFIVGAAMIYPAARAIRSSEYAQRALPFLLLLLVSVIPGLFIQGFGLERAPVGESLVAIGIISVVVGAASIASRPLGRHPLPTLAIAALIVLAGFLSATEPAAAVALGFAAGSAMFAVSRWREPSRFLPWAFVAVGCLTIASTEFVFVVDDLEGGAWQRMNTVFKFYLQAWLLIAIGAGVLLARMIGSHPRFSMGGAGSQLGVVANRIEHADSDMVEARNWPRTVRTALAGAGLIALVIGLTYPLFATPVRLRQDMPTSPTELTLDGYAWMEDGSITNGTGDVISFSGDLDAINWLNSYADQTAVIVEAGIGPYRGNGARISSGTGMPAIIGWDRHQYQQRYPEGIAQRMADVRTIYNSPDPAQKLELLRRYNARYVVVGDVERFWNTPENPEYYASEQGLQTFESMLGQSLRLAFVSGSTRVYEVLDFPAIQPAPDAFHNL